MTTRVFSKLQWLTWIYVGSVSVWLLLRWFFFDCCWWLALINYFGEYYFTPVPILVLVLVFKKDWRTLIPLTIPMAAFGVLFGEFFLPNAAFVAAQPDSQTLTATSFNLLWSNADYAAIAAAVRAASPDIVGFQEFHPTHYAGIVAQLETDYPYRTPVPADPNGGVGLFSRYPIVSTDPFPLPPRNLSIHVIINLNNQLVHVFVVHLSANYMAGYPLDQFIPLAIERNESRLAETALLREIIAPINEPVILLCDCNLTDTSQAYQTLSSFLIDSHREAGWGFGRTLLLPNTTITIQRIDYIWHNAAFSAQETQVGVWGGSDHLPTTAKLAFQNIK